MPKIIITVPVAVQGAGGNRRTPRISYPDAPFTWEQNLPITEAVPTNTGGPVVGYSVISGSLPTGIDLHPTTGVLSGTPTTVGSGSATIRATGEVGQHSVTVEWAVTEEAVDVFDFSYPASPLIVESGDTNVELLAVEETPQGATSYTLAPGEDPLPYGFQLDAATGRIYADEVEVVP